MEALSERLTLVAGVSLTGEGRKAVGEAKGVVDKILSLCDTVSKQATAACLPSLDPPVRLAGWLPPLDLD